MIDDKVPTFFSIESILFGMSCIEISFVHYDGARRQTNDPEVTNTPAIPARRLENAALNKDTLFIKQR